MGYVERDARALVCTEKGVNVIRLLEGHPLTSPGLTGDWEHRLGRIEQGEETRERFMHDIAEFARGTVGELDEKLKEVRIPRANLGPCPICGQDIVENRKGYSCWSREDPGCGFVIWKSKAGKTLPQAVARELIATGRTARPVTGFKGRSGKSFRARLALEQSDEGKWRVEFDEPWARAQGSQSRPEATSAGGRDASGARRDSEAPGRQRPEAAGRRNRPARGARGVALGPARAPGPSRAGGAALGSSAARRPRRARAPARGRAARPRARGSPGGSATASWARARRARRRSRERDWPCSGVQVT